MRGLAVLKSDSNSTPSTEQERLENANSVALAIALTTVNKQTGQLTYIVPPNHYYRIESTLVSIAESEVG